MNKGNSISAQDKLEQEYFKLLEEKHYSKITVSELVEKAGVSRMTFYRNYEDIFDMHEKVCTHFNSVVSEKLIDILEKKDENLSVFLEEFCEQLNSQRKYISLLCGENADRKLFELALPIIDEKINEKKGTLNETESFIVKFAALSGIATYFYILITGKKYSIDYLEFYKRFLDYFRKAEDAESCTEPLTEN